MKLSSWRGGSRVFQTQKKQRRSYFFRPIVEQLEDRRLLAFGDLLHTLFPEASIEHAGQQQGYSVAASANYHVVGAPFADNAGLQDVGVVNVYNTAGTRVHTLNNPSPAAEDRFGYSVAATGNYVVVGAYLDDTSATDAGRAYVYDLLSATPTLPIVVLSNPAPAVSDQFGYSVAAAGNYVVVGAWLDDAGTTDAGSAYVYDLTSATPAVPIVTLNNPTPSPGDSFGISVAAAGNYVVVGAIVDHTGAPNAGSVYVYDLTSAAPATPIATLNNPAPANSDLFGISVAAAGNHVVVGAYLDDTGAFDAGSAYVYDMTSATPATPIATLNNPSPADSDQFGISVAVSGNYVVVGANGDDTGAQDAGSAYVYDLTSVTPNVPVATLNNPTPEHGDQFGIAVAAGGDYVVVGAYLDDTHNLGLGAAYVFDAMVVTGTLSAVLTDGGNLIISDTDSTGRNNDLLVNVSGSNLVVTDANEQFTSAPTGGTLSNGKKTLTIPLSAISGSLTINGAGGNDTLTVDFSGGDAIPLGNMFFNGGNPTTGLGDKLNITGGSQGTVTYNYTNASDGSVVMSNFGTIHYTGLEPIANSGTASDIIFNLPASASTVILEDDGASNTLSQLRSANGTFETTVFANPTGSVTINRGTAADTLTVNALPDFNASLTIGSAVTPFASLTVAGAVSLTASKTLGAFASGAIAVNGAVTTSSGMVTLSAGNGITLSNALATGGGAVNLNADSDGDGNGTFSVSGAILSGFSQQAKLTTAGAGPSDEFGVSVSISGDTAIVGARFDDDGGTDSGAAHVFVRNGNLWTQQATLIPSDAAASLWFGSTVSISGDTALVGAYRHGGVGAAYVFTRSGSTWTQQAKLMAPDAEIGDVFGISVAISGDTAIVGNPNDDDAGNLTGSAYVFTRSGGLWTQQAKLTAPDAELGDLFGSSVSISDDTAVIVASSDDDAGTDFGSAYVFVRNGNTWLQQAKLTAADADNVDRYGISAAISGETVIVGAYLDDDAGSNSGAAYVYTRSGSTWLQQAKLTAADAVGAERFGVSVSVSGDRALVGAYLDDDLGLFSGSAYLFTRTGNTWSQEAKLTAADGDVNDQFGISVAIAGDTAIVGSVFDDHAGGSDAGSAYIFKQSAANTHGSIAAGSGSVTIAAGDVELQGTITSAATVFIDPTNNRPIDLGTNTAGKLGLTNAEMNQITAGVIRVGSATSGPVSISAHLSPLNSTVLHVASGAEIEQSTSASSITVDELAISARGTVTMNLSRHSAGTLAIETSNGSIIYNSAIGVQIAEVNGVMGLVNRGFGQTNVFAFAGGIAVADTNATNDIDVGGPLYLTAIANGALLTIAAGANIRGNTGDHYYQADQIDVAGTIGAAGNQVQFKASSAGAAIDLGLESPGKLCLTDAELDRVTAGTIRIGSVDSGAIAVKANIDPANTSRLYLSTGGAVTVDAGTGITVSQLAISAGGAVGFNFLTSSDVDVLAVATTTGDIQFRDSDNLTIGTVAGISGMRTMSGHIEVFTAGALTINQAIASDAGAFSLNVRADDALLAVNAPLSATQPSALASDKMAINASVSVPGQQLTLVPDYTADDNDTILVGSAVDTRANTLELSDAELDRITTALLRIGSNSNAVGTITIADAITPAGVSDLVLANSGVGNGIIFAPGGSITIPGQFNFATSSTVTTDANGVDVTASSVHFSQPLGDVGSSIAPLRIATATLSVINAFNANLYLVEEDTATWGNFGTGFAGSNSTVHFLGGTFNLSANNLISDSNFVSVDGGTFNIASFSDTVGGVRLVSGSITGTSGVLTSATNYDMQSGTVTAILGGSVGLEKTGIGTVTLSGANTYTGTTRIQAGELRLGAAGTISDASAVIVDSGGTLNVNSKVETIGSLSGSGTVSLGNSGNLSVGGDNSSTTFSGTIPFQSGGNGLVKQGTGEWTLSGSVAAVNVFVQRGTLRLGADNVIADSSSIGTTNIFGPSTFNLGGFSETIHSLSGIGGNVALGSGTLTVSNGAASPTTYSGVIGGTGGLVKQGSGTFTLNGSNTYTGPTTINTGTLEITNAAALGSSASGTTVASGATLSLAGSITVNGEALTLNGSGVAGVGALRNRTGFNTWNGPVTLASNSTIYQADQSLTIQGSVDNGGFDLTYNQDAVSSHSGSMTGVISGSGGFTKEGRWQLNMTGANTYAGVTTVNAGLLAISGQGTLGTASAGTVVNTGATLGVFGITLGGEPLSLSAGGGYAGSYGALTMTDGSVVSGPVTLTGNAIVSITNPSSTATISGPIGDEVNGFGLTLNGFSEAGRTLILAGANTYTGVTTLNSGRLLVNGSLADGPAPFDVVVNSGAVLGGTGVIAGAVQVAGSGRLSPGASAGVLSTGGVTFASGSNFDVEINGAAVGVQYDQLDVTGTVALGGATLNIDTNFSPAGTERFTLIRNDGNDPVTGAFNGLPEGAIVTIGGQNFSITYRGGDGNDVELRTKPVVSLSVSSASGSESAQTLITVTATASYPVEGNQSVDLMVSGTRITNGDYELSDGDLATDGIQIVIPAGQISGSVRFLVLDDVLFEGDETATLTIVNPSPGILLGIETSRSITIIDNDPPPQVSFSSASLEVAESVGTIMIGVRLNQVSPLDVTVPLTFGGSAGLTSDYTRPDGTMVTIPAGQLSASLRLMIVDDTVSEATENIVIGLGTPTNAVVSTQAGNATTRVVTIRDDDVVRLSFLGYSRTVSETVGTTTITVVMDGTAASPVSVPILIDGGTATRPADYSLSTAMLLFPPGVPNATASFNVDIVNDSLSEPTESIHLRLGTPQGAILGSGQTFTLNIQDNDRSVVDFGNASRLITTSSVSEKDGSAPISLRLSNPSSSAIDVTLRRTGGTATPTSDFGAIPTSIRFNPGETVKTFFVPIIDDSTNEISETINLEITAASGAYIGIAKAYTLTIDDNDPLVGIVQSDTKALANAYYRYQRDYSTIALYNAVASLRGFAQKPYPLLTSYVEGIRNSPTVIEGNQTTIEVALSAVTDHPVKVMLKRTGTATTADYSLSAVSPATLSASGELTIPAGAKSATITVTAFNEGVVEQTESVILTIQSPVGAQLWKGYDSRNLSIVDNTPVVRFSQSSRVVSEGIGTANVQVDLGVAVTHDVKLELELGGTARSVSLPFLPRDYVPPKTSLTIRAGSTSAQIPISIIDDSRREPDETITLKIKSVTGATLGTPSLHTLTIRDNDAPAASSSAAIKPGQVAIQTSSQPTNLPPLSGPIISSSSSAQVAVPGTLAISLFDGYLSNSTVFFDANRNGVLDFVDRNGDGIQDEDEPKEPSSVTGADGAVLLTVDETFDVDSNGIIDEVDGLIVAIGGVDTSTGFPLAFPLTGYFNTPAISPLTTLVTGLVENHSFDVGTAAIRLAEAFNLPSSNFTFTDALAGVRAGDPDAPYFFATAAMLHNTFTQLAATLSAAPDAPPLHSVAAAVIRDLAGRIAEEGSTLDLLSSAVIDGVIRGVLVRIGSDLSEEIIVGAAQVISAGNQQLTSVAPENSDDFLVRIVKNQVVAQGDVANDLSAAAGGTMPISDVVAQNTSNALQDQVDNATVGVIIPPGLSISDRSIFEGDEGTFTLVLTVAISEAPQQTVTVDFATDDLTATADDGDYVPTSGTLTWLAGDAEPKTITITTNGDTKYEATELFSVILSNVSNAILVKDIGFGGLINDEPLTLDVPAGPGEGGTGPQETILRLNGDLFELLTGGETVVTQPATSASPITINGTDAADDALILDLLAGNPIPAGGLIFHAGNGGNDSVTITGGEFAQIVQRLSNATDGVTILTSADTETAETTQTVQWFGLKSFLMNLGSVETLVFQLPAGVTSAVLEDADLTDSDPVLAGKMQLRSPNGEFATTVFSNPLGSVVIQGGNGADALTINDLDPAFTGTIRVVVTALGGAGVTVTHTGWSPSTGTTVEGSNYQVFTKSTGSGIVTLQIEDPTPPTVIVDIVAASLSDSNNSSLVTFSFSEATADFELGDVTVSGGVLSEFAGSGATYTAMLTIAKGFAGTVTVSVPAGSYSDSAGNLGAGHSDSVIVHAMQFVRIVDDGDAGWSLLAGQSKRSTSGGYAGDWRLLYQPNTLWVFDVTPGFYRVSATWPAYNYSFTANNAPFSVYDGSASGNPMATVRVNQRANPEADLLVNGKRFQDLDTGSGVGAGGIFTVTSNRLTVRLTGVGINGSYVVADAVRVEKVSPLIAEATGEMPHSTPRVAGLVRPPLKPADLGVHVDQALAIWSAIDANAVSMLTNVQFHIVDLPGPVLGLASEATRTIWLDKDGAGYGWTTMHDVFAGTAMDLTYVIAHEMGHLLGLPDLNPHEHAGELMSSTLKPTRTTALRGANDELLGNQQVKTRQTERELIGLSSRRSSWDSRNFTSDSHQKSESFDNQRSLTTQPVALRRPGSAWSLLQSKAIQREGRSTPEIGSTRPERDRQREILVDEYFTQLGSESM